MNDRIEPCYSERLTMSTRTSAAPLQPADFTQAFPNSSKVLIQEFERHGARHNVAAGLLTA